MWTSVRVVFRKELREALRDRRTMISTIVIPSLVVPLLLFGVGGLMRRVVGRARDETPTIAIVGGNDSRDIVTEIESARDPVRDQPMFRIVDGADYRQQISDKKLRDRK